LQGRLHYFTPGRGSRNDHVTVCLDVGPPFPGLACVDGERGMQRVHRLNHAVQWKRFRCKTQHKLNTLF